MKVENCKEIIDSLATPILYVPVYITPEGRYFLDDAQIYRQKTHSAKARKFDTFVVMAELITTLVKLHSGPR